MAKLTPAQRAYIRKRSKLHELDPSEAGGELNIVPLLDVMVVLIIILIITAISTTFLQINTDLPTTKRGIGGQKNEDASLKLQVTVVDRGVIVTGSGGKLAPGCSTTTTADMMTVERKGKAFDWNALTKCAQEIKKMFEDETQVTVTAEPTIKYQHVVAAMDAMRDHSSAKKADKCFRANSKGEFDPAGEWNKHCLFPEVLISAGVR